jgi:hypothetical protein
MLIFLGWSGPESKAAALLLKDWLKMVCSAFDPWISDDVEKGVRWSLAIAAKLRESLVGTATVRHASSTGIFMRFCLSRFGDPKRQCHQDLTVAGRSALNAAFIHSVSTDVLKEALRRDRI